MTVGFLIELNVKVNSSFAAKFSLKNEVIVMVFSVLSALQPYTVLKPSTVQESDGITYQSLGNVI